MDFRFNLMQRRDVVAIFIDMDSSIFSTDHALPYPLSSSNPNHENNNNHHHYSKNNSTTIDNIGGIPNDGVGIEENSLEGIPKRKYSNSSGFEPARTRYDIIRQALRSFVMQKQRVSPNASTSLWFSLYAVWDEVTELLPPTRGDSTAIDNALKQYMRAKANPPQQDLKTAGDTSSSLTSSINTFPFSSVARVLRHTQELFSFSTSYDPKNNNNNTSTSDITASGVNNSSTIPETNNVNSIISTSSLGVQPSTLTLVQGIILLNRDTAPPKIIPAIEILDCEPSSTSSIVRRYLDIIPLGNIIVEKRRGKVAVGDNVEIDCPCNILDLVSFTGVKHRGLAIGCALTKLLTPQTQRNIQFLSQPLHQIRVPSPVKAPPVPPPVVIGVKQQQQQQQEVKQPEKPVQVEKQIQQKKQSNEVLNEVKPGVGMTATPVGGAQQVKRTTSASSNNNNNNNNNITTPQPPPPARPLAGRTSRGSDPITGVVYAGRPRVTGRRDSNNNNNNNVTESTTPPLSGVAVTNMTNVLSPTRQHQSCIRGVVLDRPTSGKK